MGLNNSTTQTQTTYVRIANGKLVVSLKQPTEKTVSRVTKTGKTVHELLYDTITARVADLRFSERELNGIMNREYHVILRDGDDQYCLQVQHDNRNAKDIVNALANVKDFTRVITIRPYSLLKDDGKTLAGCTLYNGNTTAKEAKITGKYAKEDMPAMVEVMFKGQAQWDNTELTAFVKKIALEEVAPRIQSQRGAAMLAELDGISSTDAPTPKPSKQAASDDNDPLGFLDL